jgi:hypothetical protein
VAAALAAFWLLPPPVPKKLLGEAGHLASSPSMLLLKTLRIVVTLPAMTEHRLSIYLILVGQQTILLQRLND